MSLEFDGLGIQQTNVQGSSLLDKMGEVLAAGQVTLYPVFDVSAIPAVLSFMTERLFGASVQINFWADALATVTMGGWRFIVLPSGLPVGDGSVLQAWPTLGPWMTCRVQASALGAINYDLRLSGASLACSPLDSGGRSSLLGSESVAIAAGATVTRQAFRTQPGLGYWSAGMDGSTWTAKLEALNEDAAGAQLLAKWDSRDGRAAGLVPLPARPCRISIANTGATPQLGDFALSVVPQVG